MASVVHVQNAIKRDYAIQDWRSSLRAGPDCPGLSYHTLYANVSDIAHLGMDMFRFTSGMMAEVASLAGMLSERGGIIETMLRFCEPNQSARRDRHLKRIINVSRTSVTTCNLNIEAIRTRFEDWSSKTKRLFLALEEMNAKKAKETESVQNELHKNETNKKLQEEARAQEQRRLEEHRARIEAVKPKKEWYDDNAITLGLVWLHYASLRDELCKWEDECAKRETSIKEMTAEAERLQAALLRLSSEKSSIAEVVEVVCQSLMYASELQRRVETFMDFLSQIALLMKYIVAAGETFHDTAADTDGMLDPQIKEDLQCRAFEMKARLAFAARVSEIYMAVSTRYIMPEIDRVNCLRLHDTGSHDEINQKLEELTQRRRQIQTETGQLVSTMHEDLKKDLTCIAETCAPPSKLGEGEAGDHAS
ncbi:hypothetical protein VFPBJ_05031 [Purpureocillium lilacinum]|uniref:Uncharacterized protein n=1 Tax=Purpureocillium lilacinum TaxID=33203 RepID=A0A179GWV2_PURLI|nr:hypothetical protein VFPBJ_05031 [Purpureocillium lilacinum]